MVVRVRMSGVRHYKVFFVLWRTAVAVTPLQRIQCDQRRREGHQVPADVLPPRERGAREVPHRDVLLQRQHPIHTIMVKPTVVHIPPHSWLVDRTLCAAASQDVDCTCSRPGWQLLVDAHHCTTYRFPGHVPLH